MHIFLSIIFLGIGLLIYWFNAVYICVQKNESLKKVTKYI